MPVFRLLEHLGTRVRVLFGRWGRRLGFSEATFLVPMAVVVGVVTALAAVGFHELILFIRDGTYGAIGQDVLYGKGMWLLILIPAAGGLAVGVISRQLAGEKEGHGVVDVIESVARTKGFIRPGTAFEKILTSAITIGTGGSAGAEGPIVQIGAALSGGVGAVFRLARHQMPTLIGCGCAAGISAIFNAPIGGLLFTLEVILLDFSIRTITPIIVASVVANVTMRVVVPWLGTHLPHGGESAYITVFADPRLDIVSDNLLGWQQMGNFVLLGLACGLLGIGLIRAMSTGEGFFKRITRGGPWVKTLRPMIGGALLGVLGVAAVLISNQAMGEQGGPFGFVEYPQPAFYGDGYGVIETLLGGDFYARFEAGPLVILLAALCGVKLLATVATLASGGSGGIIAPSLFLGATLGGALGVVLRESGLFTELRPEVYALIGMAAVLAAVVHAPLASVLILFEITHEDRVLVAAMLAVIVAVGSARLINRDSLYTSALRRRGVNLSGTDPAILRRLTVEQVNLDPATTVRPDEPMPRIIELLDHLQTRDLVVVDEAGQYAGFLSADDINSALIGREALPLMIVGELMRPEIPLVRSTDDLAGVFDLFARYDVAHLPVALSSSDRVIGMVSRAGVMRSYRQHSER